MPPRKRQAKTTPAAPTVEKLAETEPPAKRQAVESTPGEAGEVEAVISVPIEQQTASSIRRLTALFNALEKDSVRKAVLLLTKVDSWVNLSEAYRTSLFDAQRRLATLYGKGTKNYNSEVFDLKYYQVNFITQLVDHSVASVEAGTADASVTEAVLELLIDLLSQLPTRRFVKPILVDRLVVERMKFNQHAFASRMHILSNLISMPLNDFTAESLTPVEVMEELETVRDQVRQVCWKSGLTEIGLSSSAVLFGSEDKTRVFVRNTPKDVLVGLLNTVFHVDIDRFLNGSVVTGYSASDVESVLFDTVVPNLFVNRLSPSTHKQDQPLLPTEADMETSGGEGVVMPKIGIQFLSFSDYFSRNRELYWQEAVGVVKSAVEEAIPRLQATWSNPLGKFVHAGSSRMALPIENAEVIEVRRGALTTSTVPSVVRAEILIDLKNLIPNVRDEWDNLRAGDCLFLIKLSRSATSSDSWKSGLGIEAIRGCETVEIVDSQGNMVSAHSNPPIGDRRIVRVSLDPVQYTRDLTVPLDCSEFNICLRLKSSEFKSALVNLRRLIADPVVNIPEWVQDTVLGYGDPRAAAPAAVMQEPKRVDMSQIFQSLEHLVEVYPSLGGAVITPPPYRIEFAPNDSEIVPISVESVGGQVRAPTIRFTRRQVEAMASAMCSGLTVIQGPPGTGKTEVTARILDLLFSNKLGKTLVVARSNESLNQILGALAGVPREYVLKWGGAADDTFSRASTINYILQLRIELLAKVKMLAVSLGLEHVADDYAFNCENANMFWLNKIEPIWDLYVKTVERITADGTAESLLVSKLESNQVPRGIESMEGYVASATKAELAKSLLRHHSIEEILFPFRRFCVQTKSDFSMDSISAIFSRLRECAPFEILRSVRDRSQFLLTCQARVVAMTSTGLSAQREMLLAQGFQYTNVIVEDCGQMLDFETFLAFAAQQDSSKVERIVLVGDHAQLPAVVTNRWVSETSNFSQSMLTRFHRLGCQTVVLETQARSRPSIASLWTWTYPGLGSLPDEGDSIPTNPGLTYEYQFVNVEKFNGQGESQPMMHYYQNLGEAEYIVAVYMYLRLKGYDGSRISILASYNGQRMLIQDVLKARCASNALFGEPATVATIDQYQGQQNDIVLVSLVRTEAPGHNSDVRRLVAALSRARLGVYVFGRVDLYASGSSEVVRIVQTMTQGRGSRLSLDLQEGQVEVDGVEHIWRILQDEMRNQLSRV